MITNFPLLGKLSEVGELLRPQAGDDQIVIPPIALNAFPISEYPIYQPGILVVSEQSLLTAIKQYSQAGIGSNVQVLACLKKGLWEITVEQSYRQTGALDTWPAVGLTIHTFVSGAPGTVLGNLYENFVPNVLGESKETLRSFVLPMNIDFQICSYAVVATVAGCTVDVSAGLIALRRL